MKIISKPVRARVLDFDIENRPLSYWIPDRPSAEITAIASCWTDDPDSMECWLLGRDDPKEMLEAFLKRYNEAGLVTGHYIRRHDLPIINGALIEFGLPHLQPKMVQDTKVDLIRESDLPVSQENLARMMRVYRKKVHMTQSDWREANRLTPEGLKKTENRVVGDVRQHMAMRMKLVKADLLKSPRIWTS
jgi:hypothetical protein